ncbi:hypothetical protein GT392_06910 [Enterococcus durans]|nr:hypothetical protein [Enterococcus durans]
MIYQWHLCQTAFITLLYRLSDSSSTVTVNYTLWNQALLIFTATIILYACYLLKNFFQQHEFLATLH